MVRNSTLVAVSLFACLGLTGPSFAQAPDGPPAVGVEPVPPDAAPKGDAPQITGKTAPATPRDERKAVDDLLGRLAKTDEPQAARRIAGAVQALWRRSGSDTIDLLTTRAAEAQRDAKLDIAIKLMDEVVSLKPDYAEGWNVRATLRYMTKSYDEAMVDIHETLVREPRHFGAWVGLGRILVESGYDAKALAAYRKALEIYPAIDGLKKQVDELTLKVEGQPI